MQWPLDFISYEDFKKHVGNTIANYGKKLDAYDLAKFNRNTIDPIKMTFDKAIYGINWETVFANEIFRQRDKANANEIGYFHQRLFDYLPYCHVPQNGHEGGWDIIYTPPEKLDVDGFPVSKVYVEMKNKHNTMNSSSAASIYTKMKTTISNEFGVACFLVEAVAAHSQNEVWVTSLNKQKVHHNLIRRVSIDQFYSLVTGDPDAFYKICTVLPQVIDEVLKENKDSLSVPHDVVYSEFEQLSENLINTSTDSEVMAIDLLGFHTYSGFDKVFNSLPNEGQRKITGK